MKAKFAVPQKLLCHLEPRSGEGSRFRMKRDSSGATRPTQKLVTLSEAKSLVLRALRFFAAAKNAAAQNDSFSLSAYCRAVWDSQNDIAKASFAPLPKFQLALVILAAVLLACNAATSAQVAPTPVPAQVLPTPAVTVLIVTSQPVTQSTSTPVTSNEQPATSQPTPNLPSPTPDPDQSSACTRPPDDMTRVQVNGQPVNARTLWMLRLAQHLYGGPGSMLRVVQGSYTPGLPESFGTHDGGGAVDISIRNPANLDEVLWDEAPKMAAALRQAGFAAWYRAPGALGPGSSAHIHAIAVGDPELSEAARRQLDGPEGYFRGLDGIPPEYGGPHPDPLGGPVICAWMLDMGYQDLR